MKNTVTDALILGKEEDNNDMFNLRLAKNRAFLKQLAKDNIDIALLQNELTNEAMRRRRSWRDSLLGVLQNNLMQLVMSFLVLIDASIVISEIVLEIQSLQTYKNNYRKQLAEVRGIVCDVIYVISHHQQYNSNCEMLSAFSATHNLTMGTAEPVSKKETFCLLDSEIHGVHNDYHSKLAGHVQKDNELLESMGKLVQQWHAIYHAHLGCILNCSTGQSGFMPKGFMSHQTNNSKGETPKLSRNHAKVRVVRMSRSESPSRNTSVPSEISLVMQSAVTFAQSSHDSVAHHLWNISGRPWEPNESGPFGPNGAKAMHDASEILHYLSIAITGLFLLCVALKVICLGRKFFQDTNGYLDAGIIVASFVSDILYVRYVSETTAAMVVLLLWRIVRLINALMMHKQQHYELRISLQQRARRVLTRKIDVLQTEKEMQDKHISALKELLREVGSSNEAIRKCKPRYQEYTKEQTNNAIKSIAALTTGMMGGLVGAPQGFQGVLSRYGGGGGLNTPSTSQKSLQHLRATESHGKIGYANECSVLMDKFSLISKHSPALQDHQHKRKYIRNIDRFANRSFDLPNDPYLNSTGTVSNSSEPSLRRDSLLNSKVPLIYESTEENGITCARTAAILPTSPVRNQPQLPRLSVEKSEGQAKMFSVDVCSQAKGANSVSVRSNYQTQQQSFPEGLHGINRQCSGGHSTKEKEDSSSPSTVNLSDLNYSRWTCILHRIRALGVGGAFSRSDTEQHSYVIWNEKRSKMLSSSTQILNSQANRMHSKQNQKAQTIVDECTDLSGLKLINEELQSIKSMKERTLIHGVTSVDGYPSDKQRTSLRSPALIPSAIRVFTCMIKKQCENGRSMEQTPTLKRTNFVDYPDRKSSMSNESSLLHSTNPGDTPTVSLRTQTLESQSTVESQPVDHTMFGPT